MVHAEDGLEQTDDARGAFQVADVGLGGADPQGAVGVAGLGRVAVGRREGGGLDGVADGGAGAVQLHVLHVRGTHAGPGQGFADDLFLGLPAGHGQALRGAVVVDRAAPDDAVDTVPVGHGPVQRLQDQEGAALTADEAVGPGVEREAAVVRGQAAELLHPFLAGGGQVEVHAAGQGERRLAAAQALDRQMHRDQRRRLGRVDRHARSAHPEEVRDAVGDDAPAGAGQRVRRDVAGVGQGRVVLPHRADEHPRRAARQRARHDPGVLQGLPGEFEHEPLLRVHAGGLAGRDAEERRVEAVHPVQVAAAPCALPALGRRGDRVGPVAQQSPERRRVRGFRQPARDADDSDTIGVRVQGEAHHIDTS
ncbi:hypothetical protein GCM10010195_36690 [Kitasatospora griseola]|nr:hypothetical protein GCM10010195_36690 [Kitasatospora griseola]